MTFKQNSFFVESHGENSVLHHPPNGKRAANYGRPQQQQRTVLRRAGFSQNDLR